MDQATQSTLGAELEHLIAVGAAADRVYQARIRRIGDVISTATLSPDAQWRAILDIVLRAAQLDHVADTFTESADGIPSTLPYLTDRTPPARGHALPASPGHQGVDDSVGQQGKL